MNEILTMNKELVITGRIGKECKLIVKSPKKKKCKCFDLGDKIPYNLTLLDDNIVALSYPNQLKADIMNLKTGRLCKLHDIIKI